MIKTIDDVIKKEVIEKNINNMITKSVKSNHLENSEENKNTFSEFLKREYVKHPDYYIDLEKESSDTKKIENKLIIELLADKLYLFACFIGKQEVTDEFWRYKDENGKQTNKTYIDNREKLILLRSRSGYWLDNNLRRINYRKERYKKNNIKKITYRELIDDIIKDKKVIEIWGNLSYNADIKSHKRNRY